MIVEHLPLARQVDLVFREMIEELSNLSSGVVFLQIRNNVIGKFGIKHDPIQSKESSFEQNNNNIESRKGLSEHQIYSFRQIAIQSLRHKSGWTHGEISYEFAIKNQMLISSVQFESSYNMSNLLLKFNHRQER